MIFREWITKQQAEKYWPRKENMPCRCWMSEDEIEPEMAIIRNHMKEVVKQMHIIREKGDLDTSLIGIVHELLDDLIQGKCREGHEI